VGSNLTAFSTDIKAKIMETPDGRDSARSKLVEIILEAKLEIGYLILGI
jgi:hypothetical protein